MAPSSHATTTATMTMRRPQLHHAVRPSSAQQRRFFLGLQQTPHPKPAMMGYLVAQGLAIVLLGDAAFAYLTNQQTNVRAISQSFGFWMDGPKFDRVHDGKLERG